MDLTEMKYRAHKNAVEKGFWDRYHSLMSKLSDDDGSWLTRIYISNCLMLICSELAEACEALRHDKLDEFHEELADVVIRLLDLCGEFGIDIESEVLKKMAHNESRPYLHNKLF